MSKSIWDSAQYLNLATFRKTGVAVETPIWFAKDGDTLYAFSTKDAGKVKRLRNSSRARIAPCTVTGKVTGDWADAEAFVRDAFGQWGEGYYSVAHVRDVLKKYEWTDHTFPAE